MDQKYDVFISYSRKDTEIADRICSALQSNGITYFIDRQGIGGGMEFPVVLAQAIRNSQLFLFLASKNSYSSKFTINEITYAFNKKERNQILPYIIDGSTLPEDLEFVFAGINWRNIRHHPIDIVLVSDLLKLLERNNKGENHKKILKKEITENDDIRKRVNITSKSKTRELEAWSIEKKWGFKDKQTGEIVIPCIWKSVSTFSEGLSCVQDDNKKYGYINEAGDIVIPCKYKKANGFSEGLAVIEDDNYKYGFIDKTGKIVIPCTWEMAYGFSEGLSAVKTKRKYNAFEKFNNHLNRFFDGMIPKDEVWGYIDKKGQIVIPCKWDYAKSFTGELAQVLNENQWEIIDKTGKIVRHGLLLK